MTLGALGRCAASLTFNVPTINLKRGLMVPAKPAHALIHHREETPCLFYIFMGLCGGELGAMLDEAARVSRPLYVCVCAYLFLSFSSSLSLSLCLCLCRCVCLCEIVCLFVCVPQIAYESAPAWLSKALKAATGATRPGRERRARGSVPRPGWALLGLNLAIGRHPTRSFGVSGWGVSYFEVSTCFHHAGSLSSKFDRKCVFLGVL